MFTNILMWLGDAFLLLDMYLVGQQRRLAWVFCIVAYRKFLECGN